MGAIGEPRIGVVIRQAQPRFVNQSGGLQGVTRSFVGHASRSEFAKLVIDQRQEFAGGIGVARLCTIQDKSHGAHGWITAEDYDKEKKITTPLNSSRRCFQIRFAEVWICWRKHGFSICCVRLRSSAPGRTQNRSNAMLSRVSPIFRLPLSKPCVRPVASDALFCSWSQQRQAFAAYLEIPSFRVEPALAA